MAVLEPVPDEPAALVDLSAAPQQPPERALLISDYHAGYEQALRTESGLDVPSRANRRRERLLTLLEQTAVDRLIILGDLMHSIGTPGGDERGELEVLFESLPAELSVTLIRGNHDGAIERWLLEDAPDGASDNRVRDSVPAGERLETRIGGTPLEIVPGAGTRLGPVGCCHGHTWPTRAVLEAPVVCFGHEHPCVRLEDEVGGRRIERCWLRGHLEPTAFRDREAYDGLSWLDSSAPAPRFVVVPAFNDLVGGTWTNHSKQSFLAPFLPAGIASAESYLLDGTRLGPYQQI